MAPYLTERGFMQLIDRLIAKANKIVMQYSDDVFIISNETGARMVDGQEFPSFEAAQEYVESLLLDDLLDCTVIINDLGAYPTESEEERKKKYEEWVAAVEAEQRLKENGGMEPFQSKDRRLI